MVTHMKTTIDIADPILARSRRLAQEQHKTLRALVEEGLLMAIETHRKRPAVRVEPVTFRGRGIAPEFSQGGWPALRRAVYEGRGG